MYGGDCKELIYIYIYIYFVCLVIWYNFFQDCIRTERSYLKLYQGNLSLSAFMNPIKCSTPSSCLFCSKVIQQLLDVIIIFTNVSMIFWSLAITNIRLQTWQNQTNGQIKLCYFCSFSFSLCFLVLNRKKTFAKQTIGHRLLHYIWKYQKSPSNWIEFLVTSCL